MISGALAATDARGAFRGAMRRAFPPALVAAGITAAVVAPAFFGDGWTITVLLLVSIYPLFLVAYYLFLGWRVTARSSGPVAPPRWRAALTSGGGAALALTLVLLAAALLSVFALEAYLYYVILPAAPTTGLRSSDIPGEQVALAMAVVAVVALLYPLGAILIGFPCAWLGAWLALRSRPTPLADPALPPAL